MTDRETRDFNIPGFLCRYTLAMSLANLGMEPSPILLWLRVRKNREHLLLAAINNFSYFLQLSTSFNHCCKREWISWPVVKTR